MTNRINWVLCDADFLIALYIDKDSNHQQAQDIYSECNNFSILNITFYEVATVLSRLFDHQLAKETLKDMKELFTNVIIFDQGMEDKTYENYYSYNKKNISFFDCACLVTAQKYGYKIASFDKFYPNEILVKI